MVHILGRVFQQIQYLLGLFSSKKAFTLYLSLEEDMLENKILLELHLLEDAQFDQFYR